jgi:hypothetical protein
VKGQYTYRGFSIDEIHGRGSVIRNTYKDKPVVLGSQYSGHYEDKHKKSISDFFDDSNDSRHDGKYLVSSEDYEYLKRIPKGNRGDPGVHVDYTGQGNINGSYHPGAEYLMAANGPFRQGLLTPIGNFNSFRNRKHQMNKRTPL